MTVRELLVKIGARVDGFDKGLSAVTKSLDRWGDSLQRTGTKLTVGLTVPIAAAFGAVTKASIDFDSAFKNVEKTVEASETELSGFRDAIRGMAQDIPKTAVELANIAAIGGQFGVSNAGLMGFTRTVADLSVAIDGISAEGAAAEMAQISKVTGTAEGQFRNMGSALVELGNKGNSTEAAILEFTKRLAGAGTLIGLTAPQIMGIGASMANLGINAEAGGTAMSKVFSKMEAAVARGGTAVAGFAEVAGMSAQRFSELFRNEPMKAIEMFVDGLSRQKDAGRSLTLVLDDLEMKDIRLTDALKRLAQSSGEMTKQVDLSTGAWEKNSALTEESGKKYKSTANQLQLLKNRITDAAIEVGDVFSSAIVDAIGQSTGFTDKLKDLGKGFSDLPSSVHLAVIGIGGFLAVIGPAAWAIGGVVKGLAGLVGVAGFVIKPLVAAAAGLSAFGVAATTLAGGGVMVQIGTWAFGISAGLLSIMGAVGVVGLVTVLGAGLYELGKAIASAYSQWKAGGSMWEFFTKTDDDNFVRRWLGLSKGVQGLVDPLKATTAAGLNLQATLEPLRPAADQVTSAFTALGPAVSGTGAAAGVASEALSKLLATLSGADAVSEATLWANAIKEIGGVTKLTTGEQERARDVLGELIEKYDALGRDVPPKIQALYDTLSRMPDLQLQIGVNKEDAAREVEALRASMQAWLQDRPLQLLIAPNTTTGVNLASTLEPFKRALGSLTKYGLGDQIVRNLGDTLKNQLGPTLMRAFQGGGDVGKSVGGLIGGSLGQSLSKSATSFLTKNLGSTLGGALGSVVPGLGTALGALAGAGMDQLFGKLFGGAAAKEADALRAKFIESAGGLDKLKAMAEAAGVSIDKLLSTKKPGEFKAEVEKLTAAWDRHEAEVKANAAALQKLVGEMGGVNSELGNLLTQATGMGALPAPLKAALQHLIEIGAVTPEVAAQFGVLSGQATVNFQKMQEVAKTYGVDLASLGSKFQSARLHEAASAIINDFDLLTRGGADVGGVLMGMRDEISALVVDSLKFGTDLPANMQPWITELMRAGLLTDENGVKLTDISGLKFSDPIQTQWEQITTALQSAVDKLGEIAAAIGSIPNQRVIDVRAQYTDPGPPPNFGDPNPDVNHGYGPNIQSGDGYATGTMGVTGSWFQNFGTAFNTNLHGVEAVVTPNQAVPFAMDVLGGAPINQSVTRDARATDSPAMLAALSSLTATLRRLPKSVAYSAVEARALRGGGA